jgi:DNA-binding transcriptional MerR regulator
MDIKIPDRLTFKRKEVINITKLDGKVLDFWELEFPGLSPVVNKLGEKYYSRIHLELILKIKNYLIEQKKTKAEVRQLLKDDELMSNQQPVGFEKKTDQQEKIKLIRLSLHEILTMLDKNDKTKY